VGIVPRFSVRQTDPIKRTAGDLGEHTMEVFRNEFGFSDEEIEQLKKKEVI
jgi:crotonobetainyl-CoA:carnitine CoA-transferase CaiB-like acyl-CoA transferase